MHNIQYSLYFESPNCERRLIDSSIEQEKILSKIYKDMALTQPDFKIYYVRSWVNDEKETYYDYGSYCSFYVAVPNN